MARRNQNINLKTTIGNQLQYIYSADELTNVLNDVAKQIGVQAGFRTNQLQCFADTSKDDRRTTRYRMRKKHGGTRAIVAPHSSLLFMLQAFNALLQDFCGQTLYFEYRPQRLLPLYHAPNGGRRFVGRAYKMLYRSR